MRLAGVIVLATALLGSGCAGYRLGPTGEQAAGAKSVRVVPLVNRTTEPRFGDAVTAALRKEIQRDGTFTLATRDAGDIVVSGVLMNYQRREVSFVPNDITTARDYDVQLTAQVTARERATGKILFDRPLTSFTLIRVGSDLPSTERQALPLLAADLGKRITSLLADGSW